MVMVVVACISLPTHALPCVSSRGVWGLDFLRLLVRMILVQQQYYNIYFIVPYSRKYWRGIKFGGLMVCEQTAKLKSANYIYPSFIRYRNAKTAKLKSANFDFRAIRQI